MEKADYYRALGLEAPSEKPAIATPESAGSSQGGQEQPVAVAAASENAQETQSTEASGAAAEAEHPSSGADAPPSPQGEGTGTGDPSTTGADGNGTMSKEERARQAKLRREREQKAAVDAALAEQKKAHDAELAAVLKNIGITNRYRDNAPIQTREDYEQWQKDADAEKLSSQLRSGKLTPEALSKAVDASPQMQKLKQQVEGFARQQQAQQRREYEQVIARELAEIQKLDPSIQSIEDALDLPTGQEFSRLVQQNHLSFPEAFRLANADRLQEVQQRVAQEQQARSYHSKDHLTGVGANARTPVAIPQKTYDAYRLLRPDMTDEQIRADYAKRNKGRA